MNNCGEILRVSDLSVSFASGRDKFFALSDVSFSVMQGEVLGVVGESGCGKTTLGRTVMRIYRPSAGEIFLRGVRINSSLPAEIKQADKEYKRRWDRPISADLQMIFQDPISSLNPRMTVREIISEGLVINGIKDRAEIDGRVYEILRTVGLTPEHAGRYPHEFSGGQRQRIGIARAAIMKPSLIIADEPVSALDVSVQAQVINLLGDLKASFGLTVIFIAHDLSVVKYFSDRIAVMYLGRIVEIAPKRELFENPVHPYTKALLSAIPIPDPILERRRGRIIYSEESRFENMRMTEVSKEHFVLCNEKDAERLGGAYEKS